MGHLFRINKQEGHTKSTIIDWSETTHTPYDHGYVEKIGDATTVKKETTSIPSPFARIELAKEAFSRVLTGYSENTEVDEIKKMLHGNSIYHKMVSDVLDVAQIFFCYPSMQDYVKIIAWDRNKHLEELEQSQEAKHRIYGKSLRMYLEQDAKGVDPYNFSQMDKMYILKYIGPGHKEMHIIGATSPASLFFSTANDEHEISQYLCLGNDCAFDTQYASLDMRDEDFIKYIFALRRSIPNFGDNYPELNRYCESVYHVLQDDIKNEVDIINSNSYLREKYDALEIEIAPNNKEMVTVNNQQLYCQRSNPAGQSDFEILPTKTIEDTKLPLVLPVSKSDVYAKMKYHKGLFGKDHKVPIMDEEEVLEKRRLPGIHDQYPYLTISDFLADHIIKLPAEVNKESYFDGNYTLQNGEKGGYLLPIKPLYFNYFSEENLKGKVNDSGKNTIEIVQNESVIWVTLRIPVKGGMVEYCRHYTKNAKVESIKETNHGCIVSAPDNFAIGIFPPVQFVNVSEAHYRVALLCDKPLCADSKCEFYPKLEKEPDYIVRNTSKDDDISSKVYLLEKRRLDFMFVSIQTDKTACKGLLIPKLRQTNSNGAYAFAIDFGTSNTHISYCEADSNKVPLALSFNKKNPQMSLVCKGSDKIMEHIRAEFVPEEIGEENAQCSFPMRTILGMEKVSTGLNENKTSSYKAFGNASPAFMYNCMDVGADYTIFETNLKWSKLDDTNTEKIKCYIESLFLMIRNKVLEEGGSLSRTQIVWFHPLSMSSNKVNIFREEWDMLFHTYFSSTNEPSCFTESVAPYRYFQRRNSGIVDVVTVDIGGGTTDILYAKGKEVQFVSSIRFAANSIFGRDLTPVENGELSGIIKQYKGKVSETLSQNKLKKLCDRLERMTKSDMGDSANVASFLFSLVNHPEVKSSGNADKLDFNRMLRKDDSQKLVFYVFYSAIMYHIAQLMKEKGHGVPPAIAFSGNGSKAISVLGSENDLAQLAEYIFAKVIGGDPKTIQIYMIKDNPKEATCEGGLDLLISHDKIDVSDKIYVSVGVDPKNTEKSPITYSDVDENVIQNVAENARECLGFILDDINGNYMKSQSSIVNKFGIDQNYIQMAQNHLKSSDLNRFVKKGIDNKKKEEREFRPNSLLDETLFFYPITGFMEELSSIICTEYTKNKNNE